MVWVRNIVLAVLAVGFGIGIAELQARGVFGWDSRPLLVRACEHVVVEMLKAPSTYKYIEHFDREGKSGSRIISVSYDANNSFNVPLRGFATCEVNSESIPDLVKFTNDGEDVFGPAYVLAEVRFSAFVIKNR